MSTPKLPPSPATVRAIERVKAGETPTAAAKVEGVHPSTLFRHLSRLRPVKLYLVIDKKPDGFDVWVENQHYKQVIADVTFKTTSELQAALPGLLSQY